MEDIDWSKAPEGATHWEPKYKSIPASWMKLENHQWNWYSDDSNNWKRGGTPNEERVQLMIERPKEQAWSGEGLPPIGTVCEVQRSNMRWYRCKIFALRGREALFDLESEQSDWDSADLSCFRPLKTQEQLAAEEREKAIHEMYRKTLAHAGDYESKIQRKVCESLYDAGYRLTKTEEQ